MSAKQYHKLEPASTIINDPIKPGPGFGLKQNSQPVLPATIESCIPLQGLIRSRRIAKHHSPQRDRNRPNIKGLSSL